MEELRHRATGLAREAADAPPTPADLATALDRLPLLNEGLSELPRPNLRAVFDSLHLQLAFQPAAQAVAVELTLIADEPPDRGGKIAQVWSVPRQELVRFQDMVDGCLTTSFTPLSKEVGDVTGSGRGHRGQDRGAGDVGGGPGLRVSRQWLHKLLKRFDEEGEAGLEPRSRRPTASPGRTPDKVEDQIVELRKALVDQGLPTRWAVSSAKRLPVTDR
jgi:hypothetical protein